jgi:hypothetical protein
LEDAVCSAQGCLSDVSTFGSQADDSKTGKEAFLLALHTVFLVARTILSVMVARLDGRIVRDLVSANGKGFLRGLGWWFALALPSTYTNSMVRPIVMRTETDSLSRAQVGTGL